MIHGGDILSYQDMFNGKIIDFSSNINPLGYPTGLKNMIIDNFDELVKYPDIQYRNLKKEISNYIGCQNNEVVVGNGAVDIINNFSMMFKRVVVVIPCFLEYIERPRMFGKEVIMLPLKKDFSIDSDLIRKTLRSGDLLILGNPNNPTGKRIGREVLLEIHGMVEEHNCFLLLDEAFYEFCQFDYDSIELFKNSKNICIIRASTKFFALPGIRLGYGFTCSEIVEKYNSIALPWNINAFADIAARTIFKDDRYIQKSKEYIACQRKFLICELEGIEIIKAYETHCNFILIKLLKGDEDEIFNFLLGKGILIRKASSFEGLDKSFIRIAVKSYEDNKYIVNCLRDYMQWRT